MSLPPWWVLDRAINIGSSNTPTAFTSPSNRAFLARVLLGGTRALVTQSTTASRAFCFFVEYTSSLWRHQLIHLTSASFKSLDLLLGRICDPQFVICDPWSTSRWVITECTAPCASQMNVLSFAAPCSHSFSVLPVCPCRMCCFRLLIHPTLLKR